MRKWLILGAIVLVLGAVIAFAAVNLDSYLNRNKAWLAAQAEQALGRRVAFEEIGISFFGGFGVRITNLRVADDPRFSLDDFVSADRIQARVRILPALFGRYQVSRLVVESPMVVVIRTSEGFNFETIGRASGSALQARPVALQEQPEVEAPYAAGSDVSEPVSLLISTLRVRSGEIRFIDRTGRPSAEGSRDICIRELDFSASDVSLTESIEVEVRAALLGSEEQNFELEGKLGPIGETLEVERVPFIATIEIDPLDADALRQAMPEAAARIPPGLGLSGALSLSGQLAGSPAEVSVSDLDFTAAVFAAEEPNLTIKGTVGPVRANRLDAALPIDLRVDLESVAIDELRKLEALAGVFPADFSAPDPVRVGVAAKGTLGRPEFDASFDGSEAAIRVGSAFVKPRGVRLELNVEGERSGETLDITDLDFRLATLAVAGRGTIVLAEPMGLDVQIDVSRTPLDGWDSLVPLLADYDLSGTVAARLHATGEVLPADPPRVEGTIDFRDLTVHLEEIPTVIEGFSSTLELQGHGVVLAPARFSLGGSPVELRATVAEFDSPIVSFTLRSDELRAASVGIAGPSGDTDEVIRGLTIDGTLTAAEGKPSLSVTVRSSGGRMRDMEYQDLGAEVRLAEGVATLDEVVLPAAGGTAKGSGHYDIRDLESPKFDLKSRVEGMQVQGLLARRFPDAAKKIEGSLYGDLSLAGAGNDWETIRRTLRGGGRAELRNGALKKVNIAEGVLGEVTGVTGLSDLIPQQVRDKYPELFNEEDTKFDTLAGSARVAEGRVVTDDLVLAAKDYTIRGRGAFTLENQVDFTGAIIASERLTDDVLVDVPVAKYLLGADGRLEIPFRLTGVFPSVRTQPNLDSVKRTVRGGLVEESVGKFLNVIGKGEDKQKRDKKKGNEKGEEKRRKKGHAREMAPSEPPSPAGDLLKEGQEEILER